MHRLVKWLTRTLFDGVAFDLKSFARVREAGERGPLIFIPCHKSHLDYLLLNNLIYQHYLHPPRIAAGKNLAFWPLGWLFRDSGAFFIRRRFPGGQTLRRSPVHIISRPSSSTGHNLEFFIEGGRSRTGKLVLPKMGLLLNMILRAYNEGAYAGPDWLSLPLSAMIRFWKRKPTSAEAGRARAKKPKAWGSWCGPASS
jgi:glycerol-3-phosphate O-acyltransferase